MPSYMCAAALIATLSIRWYILSLRQALHSLWPGCRMRLCYLHITAFAIS